MSRLAARSHCVKVTPSSHFASWSRSFGLGIGAGVAPVRAGTCAKLEVAFLLTAHDERKGVELHDKSVQTNPWKLSRAEKALFMVTMKIVLKIGVPERVKLVGSPPKVPRGLWRCAW